MSDAAFLRHSRAALLWLLPLPLLADASGLDVWLERAYFDAGRHIFPWRHVWWFNVILHDGLRTLLVFVTVAVAGLLVLAMLAPEYLAAYMPAPWRHPRVLAYLLVAMLSGPLAVVLLKHVMARPCPWSLDLFGGVAPYHTLWSRPVLDWRTPGNCFPGAHASGGFGLLAFVPLLSGRRRAAMLVLALALGLFMGWTRMMQGAHFLSHNLWSAWICWVATLLSAYLILPGENKNDRTTEIREPG